METIGTRTKNKGEALGKAGTIQEWRDANVRFWIVRHSIALLHSSLTYEWNCSAGSTLNYTTK